MLLLLLAGTGTAAPIVFHAAPTSRTYSVALVSRTYSVPASDRTYVVEP